MPTNFVLIDCENVPPQELELLREGDFHVTLFLGAQQTKIPVTRAATMHDLGTKASYVTLKEGGKNALDFLIAYHLGQLQAKEPTARFYIISKDTGFDPLRKHLKAAGIRVDRFAAISAIPALKKQLAAETKEQLEKAVDKLRSNKASPPATLKTLRGTLHALLNKELSEDQLTALIAALRQRGYVKVEKTKVTYNLPAKAATATAS